MFYRFFKVITRLCFSLAQVGVLFAAELLNFVVLWVFLMFYLALLCLIVCRRTNASLITVPASGAVIVAIMITVLTVIEV